MNNKIAFAASLLVAFAGAAQAQSTTACTCDSSSTTVRTTDGATLGRLLSNKMVCGNVGSEKWQEWHNGTDAGGALFDYKLGPTDTRDPSSRVGGYTVDATANTVTYNYTVGGSYTYDVCFVNNTNYTFCGAAYGGRNITGVRIGGAGLSSCDAVTNVAPPRTKLVR